MAPPRISGVFEQAPGPPSPRYTARHGAALGTDRLHNGIENIFETYQLGDCFLLGRIHHLMRGALGHDAPRVEAQLLAHT